MQLHDVSANANVSSIIEQAFAKDLPALTGVVGGSNLEHPGCTRFSQMATSRYHRQASGMSRAALPCRGDTAEDFRFCMRSHLPPVV